MSVIVQKMMVGVRWTTLSAISLIFLQVLQRIVLGNILLPEDFGLLGMITPFIIFAEAFTDLGISQAIIQKQDTTKDQLSSLYWLNIIAGTIIFFLMQAIVPLVVTLYQEPRLAPLLMLVSLSLLISPAGQQFRMLLQKNLKFQTLATIDVFSAFSAFAIGVLSALQGLGALALAIGVITNSLVKATLLFGVGWSNERWRPRLHFRFSDIRSYLRFGLYLMGERIVNYFSVNIDNLVIGYFLGPVALGYYTFSYQFIIMPYTKLNPIITNVAFPIFAQHQDDNALLSKSYLQGIKLIALINFPIAVGILITAPLFVPILFGSEWLPAIIFMQIMAPLGIIEAISNPSGIIYLTKGRTDIPFFLNIGLLLTRSCIFLYTVSFGAVAVSISYLLFSFIMIFPLQFFIKKLIQLEVTLFFIKLVIPLLYAVIMGVLGNLIIIITSSYGSALQLFIVVFSSLFIYIILLFILEKNYFRVLFKSFFHRRK